MTPQSFSGLRLAPRWALVLNCAALVGCSAGRPEDDPAVRLRDSAGIVIVENDLLRPQAACRVDSVPTVQIGVTEGRPEYELHRVFGATRLSDGRIALVNQGTQEIRFYDSLGAHLRRAGRPGEGPGEFRNAFHLWLLPGDTLYVGDYRPWQFLVFDSRGTWIRTIRPVPFYLNSPEVISVLADGRMVLGSRPVSASGDTDFQLRQVTVFLHGPDGAVTDTLGTYPDGRWGTVENTPNAVRLFPLFESFARIAAAGTRVVVSHSSRPELLVYSARDSLRLERIVRWTGPDRRITSGDIDAERRRITESYKGMEAGMRARFLDPEISEKRPVAEEFPAFSRLLLGRDGRIWIREFRRPAMPELQRWFGLDSSGRFECYTELPLRQNLLEVGTDYYLVEDENDDGVELILQYTLMRPSER